MDIIDQRYYENALQLKRYSRKMDTARMIIFCYGSFLWIVRAVNLYHIFYNGYAVSSAVLISNYTFITVLTGILLINVGSFYHPRAMLTILATLATADFCLDIPAIAGAVRYHVVAESPVSGTHIVVWTLRLFIAIFIIRGTISAWRYQQLKKLMTN